MNREFTDHDLDCLAWYWQAARHNPIKSGCFVHRSEPVPTHCRWCGHETEARGAVVICTRCDV